VLPRRVGPELTAELTGIKSGKFDPIGTRRAKEIGLIDDVFGDDVAGFRTQVKAVATKLARHQDWHAWMEEKKRRRAADERVKPLEAYRGEEMARSHECFFGADRSYHEARMRFVYKLGAPCVVAPVTPQPDAGHTFVVNTTPEPVATPAPEPVEVEAVKPEPTPAPEPFVPALSAKPDPGPAPFVLDNKPEAPTEPPAEVGWRLVSNS
jgi:putative two-component system hydrogenase maturation factor HypX/HoxX